MMGNISRNFHRNKNMEGEGKEIWRNLYFSSYLYSWLQCLQLAGILFMAGSDGKWKFDSLSEKRFFYFFLGYYVLFYIGFSPSSEIL